MIEDGDGWKPDYSGGYGEKKREVVDSGSLYLGKNYNNKGKQNTKNQDSPVDGWKWTENLRINQKV